MNTRTAWALARNAALCLGMLALLAACGDNEPEQRKAFIDILQKNVLNQKGGRVILLTEDDKKRIGKYEEHFTVLTNAMQSEDKLDMDAQINRVNQLTNELNRSNDAQKRGQILDEIDAAKAEVLTGIEKMIAELNAKKVALKQPEDLKVVYDQAWEKHFGKPSEIALSILDASDGFMKTVRDLNDFVLANPDKVQYQGADILILDDSVEGELAKLMEAQTVEFNNMQTVLQEAFKMQREM